MSRTTSQQAALIAAYGKDETKDKIIIKHTLSLTSPWLILSSIPLWTYLSFSNQMSWGFLPPRAIGGRKRLYAILGGITSPSVPTPWVVPLKWCRRPWRQRRQLLAEALPLVWALLLNKTTETYVELFSALRDVLLTTFGNIGTSWRSSRTSSGLPSTRYRATTISPTAGQIAAVCLEDGSIVHFLPPGLLQLILLWHV